METGFPTTDVAEKSYIIERMIIIVDHKFLFFLQVVISGDLVDSVRPGDEVVVTGVYETR